MLFIKQSAYYLATLLGITSIVCSFLLEEPKREIEVFPVIQGEVYTYKATIKPAPKIVNVPLPEAPSYESLTRREKREVDCLARNMYFEARGEPRTGLMAVGIVTMNRVFSDKFPKSICEVVHQHRGNVYQFSWVPKKKHLTNINDEVYNRVLEKAINIYLNYPEIVDITNGALFFHADYVKPNWRNLEKTTQIGRHIFYR
jgi:spore germination cell wall hydrolase CwlJ-like protein